MSRKRKNYTGLKVALILLIVAMIAATVFVIKLSLDLVSQESETRPGESILLPWNDKNAQAEIPEQTTEAETESVVATASVAAQGDLLMHMPIFDDLTKWNSAVQSADGSYDFTCVFEHIAEYTSSYDYMVANLETTFGGDEFPYRGNPAFNCPDALMDTLVDAGYDMLLTANNHCGDTLRVGIERTLDVVADYGLQTLGTRKTEEEPRYSVVDVNGIKIGMVCYTYILRMDNGKPNLNGGVALEKPEQVNWFSYNNLDQFYSEMEEILTAMEAEGAEATMLYIHWGTENELVENSYQNTIAQKMCDLGIDVIVGGHPHVVQPVELLESNTDPEHRTICVYSLGNAVSNQRLGNLSSISTAHTEDGILFSVTFEKDTDGTVYVAEADILPTWVNLYQNSNGKDVYDILPLDADRKEQWQTLYAMDDDALADAKASYDRTMAIIGGGLAEIQEYLAQEKLARDAAWQTP